MHPAFVITALLVCSGLAGVIGYMVRGWQEESRRYGDGKSDAKTARSAGREPSRGRAPIRFARTTRAADRSRRGGAAGSGSASGSEGPALDPWRGEGRLVLLVDDRIEVLSLHSSYLHQHGYDIITAGDGEAALELARSHNPAVIILDHSMPHRTGVEVARELKRDTATRHIPIVLMTAHSFGAVGMAAREAGCDSFLAKPVEPSRMLREVAALTGALRRAGD